MGASSKSASGQYQTNSRQEETVEKVDADRQRHLPVREWKVSKLQPCSSRR
jgi:hypothetical protein